jgi:hypothetical protein
LATTSPPVRASRRFLRVPSVDWPAVTQGRKTEFRQQGRYRLLTTNLSCPTAVVGYLSGANGTPRRERLLVIEEAWQEPLGAISPESLAREGFASLAEFRGYWRGRIQTGTWKPLTTVQVYRVRPLAPADVDGLGRALFLHLYGDWLDA